MQIRAIDDETSRLLIDLVVRAIACLRQLVGWWRTPVCSQPFLRCIHAYANRENNPSPNDEMVTAGVQNKMIRSTLLFSRLAVTNKAKKGTATIQNRGVNGPTAIAVNPVARCWPMS